MPNDSRQAGTKLGFHEGLGPSAFNQADGLVDSLNALQKRWENRLTRKDFHALGESYARGRLALVCYFHMPTGIAVAKEPNAATGTDDCGHVGDAIVVLLIEKANAAQFSDRDGGDNQIVFVDVVGLPDFPQKKIPSVVGPYLLEKEHREGGEGFHYATIPWRSFPRFGGHEGLTKRLPRFIGWETYANRGNVCCAHHSSHDIVERGAEVVECVAYRQHQVGRNRVGFDAKALAASLRVSVFNEFAEIGFDVALEPRLRLLEVAVGPIDL